MTKIASFIIGLVLGLSFLVSWMAWEDEAKTECQRSLPRDQVCELIAIPIFRADAR